MDANDQQRMVAQSNEPSGPMPGERGAVVQNPSRRNAMQRLSLFGLVNYRLARGESQLVFWQRYGVSQTQGAKYERGRAVVPLPTALLIALHAEGAVTDQDLARVHARISETLSIA